MVGHCQSNDEFSTLLLSAVDQDDVTLLETSLLSVTNPSTYLNRVYEKSEGQKYTLLMVACLNGYTDTARMLLDSFQVDIEISNDIKISIEDQNSKMYQSVTVLWAATAMNNFELVKLLVEHGAQVNHTTKTNSTPLRCACFHGNMIMVRYLLEHHADIHIVKERNDTNLALSVYRQHVDLVEYLVDRLECDVNECDNEGRSPLYLAVDRGSLELVQYLLKRGARHFSAIVNQMSPVMLAAEKRRNDLVNLILPSCSNLEQIQATELLGSAFACVEHGVCDLEKSFEYFSCALQLRTFYQLPKTLNKTIHAAFTYRQECQTIKQLEELRSNPDQIHIETLLILERLLGPSSVNYRNSLLYRASSLAHTSQYLQGIALLLYGLELHQQWAILVPSKPLRYVIRIFAAIVWKNSVIPMQNLFQVMKVVVDTLEHDTKEFDHILHTLLFLITITSEILTKTSVIDSDQRALYQLIRSINRCHYSTRENGSSLLHLSLSDETRSFDTYIDQICKYPSFPTVRILLQCGADVNLNNAVGNTPVHTFVANFVDCNPAILQLLCDAGAHLDYVNALQERPIDLASYPNTQQLLRAKMKLSLTCLCARFIQRKEISFHGKIGNALVGFVERH